MSFGQKPAYLNITPEISREVASFVSKLLSSISFLMV